MSGDTTFDSAPSGPEVVSHFWVCTYPFLQTVLFVARPSVSSGNQPSHLLLFDADGALINEARLDFPTGDVGILELEDLLGACKLESGMKHGHLEIRSAPFSRHCLRLFTREGACFEGEPAIVSSRKGAFVPVVFAPERSCLLVFVNHGAGTASLKCRLYCGKRTPETTFSVPAFGSRVLSVAALFPEFSAQEGFSYLQGYFRITSMDDCICGVQLLEVSGSSNETGIPGSIS